MQEDKRIKEMIKDTKEMQRIKIEIAEHSWSTLLFISRSGLIISYCGNDLLSFSTITSVSTLSSSEKEIEVGIRSLVF